MSWSNKYKRSINCDNPSGFSQKAHCAARKKRQRGEETKSKSPFNEMLQIKSHKSVEQIAKKHRLEVSFIKKQLEMGVPIEHEHTKDKELATDIALQHLDEIPDYYTRLKKMESEAKKSHKKFKDMKEEMELSNMPKVRYCPKCQKEETRDECKYGHRYWDTFSMPVRLKSYTPNTPHPGNFPEGYDHEYSMARSEIETIKSAAKRLKKKVGKGEGNLEAWVQSKITKAADYIDTAADYVDSGEMKKESVESGPILPKEKGRRAFPKGKAPKATGAKLPEFNKESVSIEDVDGNPYVEFIDIIKPEPLKPSKGIGSELLGEDSVKEKKTFNQFMAEASPAWQRKEGKNPTGGLNAKGRASAKAQGHNLKPPVTTPPSKLDPDSKSAKRRKSFCARMGGMPGPMKDEKGRPTRKALSLRKWNC